MSEPGPQPATDQPSDTIVKVGNAKFGAAHIANPQPTNIDTKNSANDMLLYVYNAGPGTAVVKFFDDAGEQVEDPLQLSPNVMSSPIERDWRTMKCGYSGGPTYVVWCRAHRNSD